MSLTAVFTFYKNEFCEQTNKCKNQQRESRVLSYKICPGGRSYKHIKQQLKTLPVNSVFNCYVLLKNQKRDWTNNRNHVLSHDICDIKTNHAYYFQIPKNLLCFMQFYLFSWSGKFSVLNQSPKWTDLRALRINICQ